MTRYRFSTPDGQIHESEAAPSQIAKANPGATITHTVETDEATGESTLTAYEGEQPVAADDEAETSGKAAAKAPADDQTAQPTQESSTR